MAFSAGKFRDKYLKLIDKKMLQNNKNTSKSPKFGSSFFNPNHGISLCFYIVRWWILVPVCKTTVIELCVFNLGSRPGGLWDDSRQDNDAQFVEIQQTLTEQTPVLITYFENDANWAELLIFRFCKENRKCETIIDKMVCKLFKAAKK